MSYDYVIDSSAWVEYLLGTDKGHRIRPLIDREDIATSIIAIAEIADKLVRNNVRFHVMLQFIQRRAVIIPLSVELALKAAQLKKEIRMKKEKFSLADGVHLATALQEAAVLVTADPDFSGLDNVMVI
ncbi:PIN domain-containing protein [Candidatus Woesearchaeota archaeon]|nr:PIN domain-containing protein [Candidatus Woesearchaeota archaeon]